MKEGHLFGYEKEEAIFSKLEEENMKIFETYPNLDGIKFCRRCGRPLEYNSDSYHKGYHVEDCRR